MEIINLDGPIGAEVRGIDLTAPIPPEAMKAIYQAFLDRMVLRFRDQPLEAQDVVRLARNFGPVQAHVARRYQHPEVPEIVINSNLDDQGKYDKLGADRGVGWHSDQPYDQLPSRATMLHAVAIPSSGGNTAFANMVMAFEQMPAPLKNRIDGMHALFKLGGRKQLTQGVLSGGQVPQAIHPVVRVHPETGRKSVYVNPYHTDSIIGLSRADSDALLDEIYAWCERPEFQWEQVWRVADTVIWENRSAWHSAIQDYPPLEPRRFLRTTISGMPTMDPDLLARLQQTLH